MFKRQELPTFRPLSPNNQSGVRTRLKLTFCKLVFPCKLAVAFSARYSIQIPPLIISGAIVCVGVLFPSPSCLAKTHITQSKFTKFRQLEVSVLSLDHPQGYN